MNQSAHIDSINANQRSDLFYYFQLHVAGRVFFYFFKNFMADVFNILLFVSELSIYQAELIHGKKYYLLFLLFPVRLLISNIIFCIAQQSYPKFMNKVKKYYIQIDRIEQEMQSPQNPNLQKIIPPEQVLRYLANTDIYDYQGSIGSREQSANRNRQNQNIQKLQAGINFLQQTLDAMNHQVIEVENLLSQRDVLYHQLDHLRAERQEIEDQIQNKIAVQKTVKIKASRGLKELNQRLRRRIRQVKDYIDKMDQENIKIEQSMSVSQNFFPKYPAPNTHNIHTYTEYRGPSSPTWLERITPQQKIYNKFNRDYFDDFRKRLQVKQDQAWQRVKRQEQQIQTRNARSLMNFNKVGMRTGFLSPKYRAY